MDSTRPVALQANRQKPLSGLNTIPLPVQPSKTVSTGGKYWSNNGRPPVGENANPKVKVECSCGNMIFQANLERHLRTHKFHNPVGQYVCDICQGRFTRNESLKRHIREKSCLKPRRAATLDAGDSLPPPRSSTKRKRADSDRKNKRQAPPAAMVHKGKAHHAVPKIPLPRSPTPVKAENTQFVNRPVDHPTPAWTASSQFDDDDDCYDDDDVDEDEFQEGSDFEPEAENEDDSDYDADEPPRQPVEVTDILPLPVVDMSVNPDLFDILAECGINEDDEISDPLYFGTSDVPLMTNPYYCDDTYVHF
ncbi:hypothetical protein AB1N83_010212 [Pleurotus pulmonarius]|nr:hypothetical protein EYR38_009901 [Pleurotus pulmonarius]